MECSADTHICILRKTRSAYIGREGRVAIGEMPDLDWCQQLLEGLRALRATSSLYVLQSQGKISAHILKHQLKQNDEKFGVEYSRKCIRLSGFPDSSIVPKIQPSLLTHPRVPWMTCTVYKMNSRILSLDCAGSFRDGKALVDRFHVTKILSSDKIWRF